MTHCDHCGKATLNAEDDYAEIVCDSCLDNRAEAAWENFCSDFHDGGATQFKPLQQQQAEAMKLKR